MSKKVQNIKRLEIIKNLIELEEEESIHEQIKKLKAQNDSELDEIIEILENDDYSKINDAIDAYIHSYKNAKLTIHQQEIFDAISKDIDDILAYHHSQVSDEMSPTIVKDDTTHPDSYAFTSTKTPNEYFLSLSGSAGTGKTFVISKLVEEFIKKGYKILLTTPTHKSLKVAKYMIMANTQNLHVNAKTLQSYLDITLEEDFIKGTKAFRRSKTKDIHDFERNLDILIVDESSMVSNELLAFLEENLKQNKLKSILFIGDQYQLPPVDEGANGVASLPKQYKLTQILRQSDNSYIKLIAHDIKECIKTKKFTPIVDILNKTKYPQLEVFYDIQDLILDFTKNQNWYENNIILSYTNAQVDKFNNILRYRYWQEQDIQPKDYIIANEKLVFNEPYGNSFQNADNIVVSSVVKKFNEHIKIYYFECTDALGRRFKVVDEDYKKEYNQYLINVVNKAKKIPLSKKEERSKAWKHYFATKNDYANVRYVYASTIHKSQGSTYGNVYIDINSIIRLISQEEKDMAYRLLYVAVTRASKDIKLLL